MRVYSAVARTRLLAQHFLYLPVCVYKILMCAFLMHAGGPIGLALAFAWYGSFAGSRNNSHPIIYAPSLGILLALSLASHRALEPEICHLVPGVA